MAVIFWLLSTSLTGWAAAPPETLPKYIPGTCIIDAEDPFEPNVQMDKGPLKGLCVNPLTRRSLKILNDAEAAPYFVAKPDQVVVANFSHDDRFWIARIPFTQISRMILQVQYFPIVKFPKVEIAHTQILIEFNEGAEILLLPQRRQLPSVLTPLRLKRMLFSAENIGPFGEKFHADRGLRGHYHLAYRGVSLSAKYKWMITQQNHVVKQHLIKLQPNQLRLVFNEALSRANKWSTKRGYNTFYPNCVSELFSIIDDSLKIKGFSQPFLPNVAAQELQRRDLLDRKTKIPNLKEYYDGQL